MTTDLLALGADIAPTFGVALGRVHWLTGLCLLAIAVYWLAQGRLQGQQGLWPRLGLLPIGLASLLGAPLLDVPALFGMGAAFALIALYWPLNVLRRPHPQAWIAGVIGALAGVYCLAATLVDQNVWALLLGVALSLQSLYALLWLMGYRVRSRARRQRDAAPIPLALSPAPVLPLWVRTRPATVPDPPDLELSLEVQGSSVQNISGKRLEMLGWSAAHSNEWRPVQQRSGTPLRYLPVGEQAYLQGPAAHYAGGVRVWYTRQGEDTLYLFRADWVSSAAAGERVLN